MARITLMRQPGRGFSFTKLFGRACSAILHARQITIRGQQKEKVKLKFRVKFQPTGQPRTVEAGHTTLWGASPGGVPSPDPANSFVLDSGEIPGGCELWGRRWGQACRDWSEGKAIVPGGKQERMCVRE